MNELFSQDSLLLRFSDGYAFLLSFLSLLCIYKTKYNWKKTFSGICFYLICGYVSLLILEKLSDGNSAVYIFNFTFWSTLFSIAFTKGTAKITFLVSAMSAVSWCQLLLLSRIITRFLSAHSVHISNRLPTMCLFTLCIVFLSYSSIIPTRTVPFSYWITTVSVLTIGTLISLSPPAVAISLETDHLYLRLLFSLGILFIEYVTFWFAKVLIEKSEHDIFEITHQQQRKETNHLTTESIRLNEKLLAQKHETNHYIGLVDALINKGEISKAQEILKEMGVFSENSAPLIQTGNAYADAILNQKASQAYNMKVPFQVEAYLPESLPLSMTDLCSIIYNLVNNALEASLSVPDPRIFISIRPVKAYLVILVCNSVSSDILSENPELHTTKPDADLHGFGIRIVKKIARKYDGITTFEVRDHNFIAEVLLKVYQI